MNGNSSESLRDTLPITKSAYTASASVSKATAWKFFVVSYLINDEYTVEHPLKRGKQRVWVPTAKGGASPTPRLSGAKPPSPHFSTAQILKNAR